MEKNILSRDECHDRFMSGMAYINIYTRYDTSYFDILVLGIGRVWWTTSAHCDITRSFSDSTELDPGRRIYGIVCHWTGTNVGCVWIPLFLL